MCGIHGITIPDRPTIERMLNSTRHRGPDGSGIFTDAHVALAHNRLKIIDLSERAAQPMTDVSRRYTIVFNGEIYNYRELRATIDYPFRSASDTEVILALWGSEGPRSVAKLRGIFAFAVYDSVQRSITLVRDHLGVKPLYYSIQIRDGRATLLFASEIKSLLSAGCEARLDPARVSPYFQLLYNPGPDTLFREIKRVPAASILEWNSGSYTITSYWRPSEPIGPPASISELESEVRRAVTEQLVSDRPVGIFLSGGIDSSVVLDCVVRGGDRLRTFSLGFDVTKDEDPSKFNADFLLARRTAAHYRTEHTEILLTEREFNDELSSVVEYLDEPIANPTTVPMLVLSRRVKDFVTVALNGSGGDELFGGYPRYRRSLILKALGTLPRSVLAAMHALHRRVPSRIPQGVERHLRFLAIPNERLAALIRPPYWSPDALVHEWESRFGSLIADYGLDRVFGRIDRETWLIDESLMSLDKLSMAAGLEVRVPLLDVKLVEMADRLSPFDKVGAFELKKPLRRAFRSSLPPFLLRQKKRGWFSPFAKWVRRPLMTGFVRDVVHSARGSDAEVVVNLGEVERFLDDHLARRQYRSNEIFSAVMFLLWFRHYRVSL